jgi:amino acid transporter
MTELFSAIMLLALLVLFASMSYFGIKKVFRRARFFPCFAVALSMAFLAVSLLTDFTCAFINEAQNFPVLGLITATIGAIAFIAILFFAGLFVLTSFLRVKRRIYGMRYSMPMERVGGGASGLTEETTFHPFRTEASAETVRRHPDTSEELILELDLTEDS